MKQTLIFFLLILNYISALAQDNTVKFNESSSQDELNMFNLSIEELLNVEIEVASKEKVKKDDAPAFVTVYTEKDIQKLGYYTLKELASITPGFSSANIFAGKHNFLVRGQRSEGFDNGKVLVLLDGIAVNHLRNNRAPMEEEMSLVGIERVEFMRGSGSAVYGTSAFFGVINIIPKSRKTRGINSSANFYFGQYGTRGMRGYTVSKTGNFESRLRVSSSYQGPTGKIRGYSSGQTNQTDEARNNKGYDKSESLHVDTSIKILEGGLEGLTLGYFNNDNTNGTFEVDGTDQFNGLGYRYATSSLYGKYNVDLSDKVSTNSYLKFTESLEESLRWNYSFVFRGYEALVQVNQQTAKKDRSFIYGFNYDARRLEDNSQGTVQGDGEDSAVGADAFLERGSDYIRTSSAYLQYSDRFMTNKPLILVAGFRYDNSESDFADAPAVSPRVSLVQKVTDKINIKFLHSSALNSPDLKGTLINAELYEQGTATPPKLTAETATTNEIGATFSDDKLFTSITYFDMRVKNAINKVTDNGYYNNEGETISKGVEFDFKYKQSSSVEYFANYTKTDSSFPDANDNTNLNGQEIDGIPTWSMNLGTYFKYKSFGIYLIAKHIDAITSGSDFTSDHTGFTFLDTNFTYLYNPFLKFSLKVNNITNTEARIEEHQEHYNPMKIIVDTSYNF